MRWMPLCRVGLSFIGCIVIAPMLGALDCASVRDSRDIAASLQERNSAPEVLYHARHALSSPTCFENDETAHLYSLKAWAEERLGRYPEARETLRVLCELRKEEPDNAFRQINVVICKSNLATLDLLTGDAEGAVEAYREAEHVFRNTLDGNQLSVSDRRAVAHGLIGLTVNLAAAHRLSDLKEADALYARALNLEDEYPSEILRSSIYNEYAQLLMLIPGRYEHARELLEKSLTLRAVEDAIGRGHTLWNLARVLRLMGRNPEAIGRGEQALRAFIQGTGSDRALFVARAIEGLCMLRGTGRSVEERILCHSRAYDALPEGFSSTDHVNLHLEGASLLLEVADMQRSTTVRLSTLESVEQHIRKAEDAARRANARLPFRYWGIVAQSAEARNDVSTWLTAAKMALSLASTPTDLIQATSLLMLASVGDDPMRWQEAVSLADQVITHLSADGIEDDAVEIATLSHNAASIISNASLKTSDAELSRELSHQARQWSDRAVAALETRPGAALDVLLACDRTPKSAAQYSSIYLLAAINRLFVDPNDDPVGVFALLGRAEGGMARLTRRASLGRLNREATPWQNDLDRFLRMLDAWNSLACGNEVDHEYLADLRDALSHEHERLSRIDELHQFLSAGYPDLHRIAAALGRDEAVVGFVGTPDIVLSYILYSVDSTLGLHIRKAGASIEDTMTAIGVLRDSVRPASADAQLGPYPTLEASLVYQSLFAPVILAANDFQFTPKKLLVVLHDALLGVPFNSLLLTDSVGEDRWLGIAYQLSFLPGIRSVTELRRDRGVMRTFLGLGDPDLGVNRLGSLAGTREEVNDVAKIFQPHSRVLVGPEATKSDLLDALSTKPDVVLIATHGRSVPREDRWERYDFGLALTSDGSDDAHLTSSDIQGVDLREVKLFALSVCNTAVSKEGMTRLLASIIERGAWRTIASQWYVADESTKDFMVTAFKGIDSGMEVSTALQAAMTMLAEDPSSSHPYFWAPFLMVGLPEGGP